MINLLFVLDANIIFVKNVLWSDTRKVPDVIFAMPKLMALLIQRKKLSREIK